MKKTVWTFGILCGVISVGLMLASMSLQSGIGSHSELIGYTILVASALFVFFGVKSYRDNAAGGQITFGKAFLVGLLISLVASVCYVIGFELFNHFVHTYSMDGYFDALRQQAQASHLSPAALQAKLEEIRIGQERYQSLFWNAAYTFIEPFPVLLLMSVISAAILRRRSSRPAEAVAAA